MLKVSISNIVAGFSVDFSGCNNTSPFDKDEFPNQMKKFGGGARGHDLLYPAGASIGVPMEECPLCETEFIPYLVKVCCGIVNERGLDIVGISTGSLATTPWCPTSLSRSTRGWGTLPWRTSVGKMSVWSPVFSSLSSSSCLILFSHWRCTPHLLRLARLT